MSRSREQPISEGFLCRLSGEEALAIWRMRSPRNFAVAANVTKLLRQIAHELTEGRTNGFRIPPEVLHQFRGPFAAIGVELDWLEEHPGELTTTEPDEVQEGDS